MSMLRSRTVLGAISALLLLTFGAAAVLWPASEEAPPAKAGAVREAPIAVQRPQINTENYRPEKAGFAVQVRDLTVPYRVMGLFAMPGEAVPIRARLADPSAPFALHAEAGAVLPTGPRSWTWTAPRNAAGGPYPLSVVNEESGEVVQLNAFVKRPFERQRERLNGYRIGRYESRLYKGDSAYARPEGFIPLTRANRDARVAPHFTLGQFACKQAGGYPKYLLLQEKLLLKLEAILEEINAQNRFDVRTLHVMSGYRTPWYNKSIGNTTTYSRHLYGGAADIFVDTDGDTYMDDLTGDGTATVADARAMAAIVEGQHGKSWFTPLIGGLGVYSPASHRGPFIHVDVRGTPARW